MIVERLQAAIDVLSYVRDNKDTVILAIVKQHEPYALELNKQQLSKGKDTKGERLKPAYTDRYAKYKRQRGLTHDRVDLKLEGDFQGAFRIEYFKDRFEITSDDFKLKFLVKKYGTIMGLSEANLAKFCGKVLVSLQKEIREKFFSQINQPVTSAS